jgi:3-methyladenine DNA glycosylase AlkD
MTGASPDAAAEAARLEQSLRELGTPERAVAAKAYLKSDMEFAGATVPAIRSLVGSWCRASQPLTRARLIAVTRALWARPLFECRTAATLLLEGSTSLLQAEDVSLLEELLRDSHTWALVDGLAPNVAGRLAERCPELGGTLDRWAADEDFWLRRSALLALLVPLRRGAGDFGRFSRYADQMLEEREFFIRKAIGWILRETAKKRPALVADWLAPRLHRASGVTVREAVKPLAPAVRDQLLAGYRDKRPITLQPQTPDRPAGLAPATAR